MNSFTLHPATRRLLGFQAGARLNRMMRGLCSPRRVLWSTVGLLLAIVWLGQAVLGVLFREPADPAKLLIWIPAGLLVYTLFHLVKAACRKPIEPFEWTTAEQEQLGGAPLRRSDLVTYRVAAIGFAAIAKAACFALVLLPDLNVWITGFLGMLLGLMFVDLARMAFDVFAYALARREFWFFRAAVLALVGGALLTALIHGVLLAETTDATSETSFGLLWQFVDSLHQLRTTWIGTVLESPFQVFANTILAPSLSLECLGYLALSAALVLLLTQGVVYLDGWCLRRRVAAERARFGQLKDESVSPQSFATETRPLRVPRRWAGAGVLAWRQFLGTRTYAASILVALLVPAALSGLALVKPKPLITMMFELTGGLVFYSFVLLPAALRFDFRRDVDRLATLKALPISPTGVTIGQLLVPVTICTVFQAVVLLLALAIRPYPPAWLAIALVVLVPINVLIFSLENLIFLLYPYRPNEEGLGVFVRSILTFTGKGILFGVAFGLTLVWALVSKSIGIQLFPGNPWGGPALIFASGMWLVTSGLAIGLTAFLVRVYRRFDPSQDTPALT